MVSPNSTKYTSLEHELYLNLQRLALTLSYDVFELFKAHGLSGPQFNILRILRGASPADIPLVKNQEAKLYLNVRLASRLGIVFKPELVKNATVIK